MMNAMARPLRHTDVPISFLAKVLRLPRTHQVVRYAWELERVNLRWDEEAIPCIYAILDTRDADIYIGQTKDVYARKCWHDSRLRRQKHSNCLLQDACPGGIDNRRWRFLVLEEVHEGKWRRLEREYWWHNHVPSCINVQNDRMTREFWALGCW
jgi:hypothetical protein